MPKKMMDSNFVIDTPIGEVKVSAEKLKDLLNYLNNNIEKVEPMDQSISDYFNVSISSLEIKQKEYTGKEYITWAWSLMEVLEEQYNIKKIENFKFGSSETPPIWKTEEIRGTTYKIPYKLTLFLESKVDSHKLVVSFWPYDQYEVDIKFYFESECTNIYEEFWSLVKTHFNTKGLLKNNKFSADFAFLDVPSVTWDDIIIEKESKEVIDRNIINFIPHLEVYESNNLRASRGILISGPPGTGKTLCCNVIMNQINVTTIYVARNSIHNEGQINQLYKLARHLSPTLVILEDIDTLGGLDRREVVDHPLLGEFLNCLSGVEKNTGVITLATTNYPQHLDWALADRPGRFDVRLEFGYPNGKARKAILEQYLTPFNHDININALVKKTEGFSGAYLQEIVQNSFMVAFERANYDENDTKINTKDVEKVVGSLLEQRKKTSVERGVSTISSELYG